MKQLWLSLSSILVHKCSKLDPNWQWLSIRWLLGAEEIKRSVRFTGHHARLLQTSFVFKSGSRDDAISSQTPSTLPPPAPVAFTPVPWRQQHMWPEGGGEHSDHWGSTCPVPVSTWGHYQVSSSPETREICTRRIPSPSVLHTVLANILLPFTAGCKVFLAKWEERRRGFCSNKKRFWLWLGPVLSPLTRNSLS